MSDSPDEWGESRRGGSRGAGGSLYDSGGGGYGSLAVGSGLGSGMGPSSSSSSLGQGNGMSYTPYPPLAPVPLPPPSASAVDASSTPHRRKAEEVRPYQSMKSWYFIHLLASSLKLGKVATHTALVFFHRFFQHQSFDEHDRSLVAAACVYLAAKVEERSNVKLSHMVLQFLILTSTLRRDVTFADYQLHAKKDPPGPIAVMVNSWKNRVIVAERTLLYTINFNLNVTKPFKALGDLMRVLREAMGSNEQFDHRTFFAQACKFLNDCMMLPEVAEVEASYAAAMALYLTALLNRLELPSQKSWADVLQIQNEDRFHQDCLQALDLYNERHWRNLNLDFKPPQEVEVDRPPWMIR